MSGESKGHQSSANASTSLDVYIAGLDYANPDFRSITIMEVVCSCHMQPEKLCPAPRAGTAQLMILARDRRSYG